MILASIRQERRHVSLRMARLGSIRATEILEQVARDHRIGVVQLRSHHQPKHFIDARRDFCQRARGEGLSMSVIAEVLKKDRSTVSYHLRPDVQERKRAMRVYKSTWQAAADA